MHVLTLIVIPLHVLSSGLILHDIYSKSCTVICKYMIPLLHVSAYTGDLKCTLYGVIGYELTIRALKMATRYILMGLF